MDIILRTFQIKAIADLNAAMEQPNRDIILKSCTGSGKTIILTHFMDEYFKSNHKTVFIWLTPGKGNLEEQSKEKMDRYIHGSQTKLLSDIMTSGFEENDACFINWEKLTKKGNNALKDSERTNLIEHIRNALDDGLNFKIIVDESHQHDTIKADDIIELFQSDKIIRCSATPKNYKDAVLIDIPEEDVIAEGLIKKLLIINENFEQHINVDDQIKYLLDKAIDKQRELHSEYLNRKAEINPLIIVQIPNKSDALLDRVEEYFESKGITYENNSLAVWLSDKKQNLEYIEEPNAEPIAVIIKQAVATGWDCPRAQILVKLRDNMSEVFEIQTIGRIRRMPEAKHYESDLLDSCYLYTLDEKFTESVKLSLGKGALDAYKVFLKPEHRSFTLISEYKTDVPYPRDAKLSLKVIHKYFEKKYHITGDTAKNKVLLEAYGYSFSEDIIDYTKSGSVSTLSKENIAELNDISIHEALNTHKHGKEYHHCVAEIGYKVNLDYNSTNTIMRKLFLNGLRCDSKILKIETRELYAFIINNEHLLVEDVRDAMADESLQLTLAIPKTTEKPIGFPLEMIFTYDGTAKSQAEFSKNVYKGYLSSAEKRSLPEKLFERYCENSKNIQWFYKNGDKGIEYFSIVYTDNFGKQKSFYPDYVVGTNDSKVWIIETKGGFTKSGDSEDIDKYTAKKFKELKSYTDKYNLFGGIVRQDKQSSELCICTETYSDDIKSNSWKLLSDVL
ncbi:restriction endonuclease subunit R [bacterium 1xD8-6]|nr:restriction endonuclease subunit R [bacterium D16-36]RKI63366.1 restriction endonuclease subunit R [bacterium 1xD8-6]